MGYTRHNVGISMNRMDNCDTTQQEHPAIRIVDSHAAGSFDLLPTSKALSKINFNCLFG